MRSLIDFGSALATYGGLSYLVSLSFWDWWIVSNTTRFYQWGMHYLCTLLFIIIQQKDTLQYSSLHSRDSVSILLFIFLVYACENYLSRNIYFIYFFLEYLLIALELLFLHGIRVQGCPILISFDVNFACLISNFAIVGVLSLGFNFHINSTSLIGKIKFYWIQLINIIKIDLLNMINPHR